MYAIVYLKDDMEDTFREGIIPMEEIVTVHDVTYWPRWNKLREDCKPVLRVEYGDDEHVFIRSEIGAFLRRLNAHC